MCAPKPLSTRPNSFLFLLTVVIMLFLCANAAHVSIFSYSFSQSIFPCGDRIFHQDYTTKLTVCIEFELEKYAQCAIVEQKLFVVMLWIFAKTMLWTFGKSEQKKKKWNGAIKCNVNCGIWMLECGFRQSKCVTSHAYCNEQQWRASNAELSRSVFKKKIKNNNNISKIRR